MRVVIPGGTGQVGTVVARHFHAAGHEVVVIARGVRGPEQTNPLRHDGAASSSVGPAPWKIVQWDGATLDEWAREIDGADIVINLAGRSVNCRYTAENRRAI